MKRKKDDDDHDDENEHHRPKSCFPPSDACFPVVPGAKHKLSREQKLTQLADGMSVPSSLAAGTIHIARRFLLEKKAANPPEKAVFAALKGLPRDLLSCTLSAFDSVPPAQRDRLFERSEAYLKAVRKRSLWVEPLFGEAKEFHHLRRFRLRRLHKVNIEGVMVAAGQNLKRLIRHYFAIFFFSQNPLFVSNFSLFRTFSTGCKIVRR